jgi:hypothetical protein
MSWSVCPGKAFQPSIMFAGKARVAWVTSLGSAVALLTNIRLDWKGLPGTNTLAYYEKS